MTVEHVRPEIDGGRFPIKRTIGERVDVTADIFADGHDVVAAVLRDRPTSTAEDAKTAEKNLLSASYAPAAPKLASRTSSEGGGSAVQRSEWRETPMLLVAPGSDEWTASFDTTRMGWHEYEIVAWVDRFQTWRRDVKAKAAADQDVSLELLEGSLLVRETASRAERLGAAADAHWLLERADALSDSTPIDQRLNTALDDGLSTRMFTYVDRSRATTSPPRRVWVDRERARFGAWYEMFPRSAGPDPTRSATFREAGAALARIADLGFDIVYLPPIHPIGRSFRKGRNNALSAAPSDPGSPWAIGSAEGGHTAVEPGLGTLDDFDAFREEAERLGLEIALDLAWQCSPDHPWVREHPEWFRHRPDGTIRYA